MTRRLILAVGFVAMILAGAPLSAHDEYRIIGTVSKVSAKKLDVKQTKDGKTISMMTDDLSVVTRDGKKVNRSELKTGLNVVVDGIGDTIEDLLVLEVKIVPAPAKK